MAPRRPEEASTAAPRRVPAERGSPRSSRRAAIPLPRAPDGTTWGGRRSRTLRRDVFRARLGVATPEPPLINWRLTQRHLHRVGQLDVRRCEGLSMMVFLVMMRRRRSESRRAAGCRDSDGAAWRRHSRRLRGAGSRLRCRLRGGRSFLRNAVEGPTSLHTCSWPEPAIGRSRTSRHPPMVRRPVRVGLRRPQKTNDHRARRGSEILCEFIARELDSLGHRERARTTVEPERSLDPASAPIRSVRPRTPVVVVADRLAVVTEIVGRASGCASLKCSRQQERLPRKLQRQPESAWPRAAEQVFSR